MNRNGGVVYVHMPPEAFTSVSLWGGVYRVDAQSEVREVMLFIWVNIPQSDVSRRVNRLEIAAWAC